MLKPSLFLLLAGAIQLNADISGYTTTGYDINVTVWDAKNTVGPKILTVIVRGTCIVQLFSIHNTPNW